MDVVATAIKFAQVIAIAVVAFAVLLFIGLIFVEVIAWRRQRFFMRAGVDDPIEELAHSLACDGKPALTWVVLTRTIYGRRLYAVGDNERAARLSGLPVRAYRASAYIFCGAFAGLAGILFAARTGIVSPSIGVGMVGSVGVFCVGTVGTVGSVTTPHPTSPTACRWRSRTG